MQKLQKTIFINAPVEKVWKTMLEDTTYRQWTEAFGKGSYFVGSWEKGEEMRFLAPDEGGESGMIAIVRENKPHEFVSLEHVGMIMKGVEDRDSEDVKKWTPAFENYTFVEKDGGTEVTVEMDINEEHKDMFEDMWPKALEKLKELSEK